MKQSIFNSSLAYALTLLIGSVSTAHAAPGSITQQPLFLQNSVPSNIFFLVDNSDSMRYELITRDDSTGAGGGLNVDSDDNIFSSTATPAFIDNSDCTLKIPDIDSRSYTTILQTTSHGLCSTTVAEEEWRARLYEYNGLYYNPNRVYQPWAGNDSDGIPFAQASITAARVDPSSPDSGTINLTTESALLVDGERNYYSSGAWKAWCTGTDTDTDTCVGWRYYTWNDADDDKLIDSDELTTHWVNALDPGTGSNPPANNQQNFANWFSYHRSRELSAKYAVSIAINEASQSQARIGYASINDDNSIRIDAPNAISGSDDTTSHKQDVLTKLFNTRLNPGTPLRTTLKAAGNYYQTGSMFYNDGGTIDYTPGASPILSAEDGGACQSNNTILMTDGINSGNLPDVGNVDGDNGAPYADNFSNTLADVAMYYYETDLAPGLEAQDNADLIREKDYTPGVSDTELQQNMNTHAIAFGLIGNIENPTAETINADGFNWEKPVDSANIDDLFHAAVNGRGNYVNAADPDELVNALVSIVNNITDITQSATSVAMSAFQLKNESLIYFSRFTPGSWTGELIANEINFDTDNNLSLSLKWKAGEKLEDKNPSNRTIYTYNNGGVTFEWDNISTTMQDELKNGDNDEIGEARLNFLRGITDADASFRERDSILGDIVNSSPTYVGAPSSPYPDSAPFGTSSKPFFDFWDDNKDRTKMLYVGANDGMLHGFNAITGEEEMAYVPATIAKNLHELTDPEYTHRFFVDATPVVGDAFYDNDWHTVLVGTLGAGGKGLFALDITDPASFTNANAGGNVLWEFNNTSDNDVGMGYSFSQPTIALMENGRWGAIVGNGYNSDDGDATLFIIYLDADPSNGWDLGTDYIKISTGVGTPTDKNGLSTPAVVDSNGDGYVDRVYAGDLKGNMWVFNLADSNSNNWDVTYKSGSTPQPLFQAVNAADKVQAITVKPSIIRHPDYPTITDTDDLNKNSSPNLMVLFGTGQYVSTADLTNTQTQSFYAVWDKGEAGRSRDNLIEQIITSGTDDSIEARVTSNKTVPYGETSNNQRFGWYIDLDKANATTGERVVSDAVVINDVVFFTTYIPNPDPCGTGGDSWFMFLKASNGAYPDEPIVSINGDSLVDEDDEVDLTNNDTDDATAPSGLKIEGTLGSPSLDLGDNSNALLNTNDGVKNFATDLGGNGRKRLSWRELRQQ